ncbi:MAG TPA: hypothetical protein VMU99_05415 [Acidimicrobiales bacterium]|nr:hypothetical protein [Acidimicrobiales bacterium]
MANTYFKQSGSYQSAFGITVLSVALTVALAVPAFGQSAKSSLSLSGTVERVNASGHNFAIKTVPGGAMVTVTVPASARIFYVLSGRAPAIGPISELKAGDTVVAEGTMAGGGFTAVTIDATNVSVPKQGGPTNYGSGIPTSGMGGTITGVNAGAHSFTLKTDISPTVGETGKTYTVLTNSSTTFLSTTGKKENFAALRVGEHIGAVGSTTSTGYLARNLAIRLSGGSPKTEETTTTVRSGNTTVSGSNGSISVGTKLPAGFPKSVPLPAGSTLLSQVSTGSKFFDLWFAVDGTQTAVFNTYKKALEKAGFSISSTGGVAGSAMVIVSQGSAAGATATVMAHGVVSGVPSSEVKSGQVELVLVVT